MPYYGALTNPTFEPAVRDIAAITNSYPVVVTTTFAHSYLSGLIVRIVIPVGLGYGMEQLNQYVASIIVTGDTTFTMNTDTSNYDPFVIPMEAVNQPLFTPAQVVPVGELTSQLDQSFVNILTPQF